MNLSSKDKLFENLCIYCEVLYLLLKLIIFIKKKKNKLDVFDYIPLSFEIYFDELL